MIRWGAGIVAGLLIAAAVGWHFGDPILKRYIESDSFHRLLIKEVSKAIKIDAEAESIHLNGLEANTSQFGGNGWPGEAIARIEGQDMRAKFNPWAIFRRKWQIDRMDIDSGSFALRLPDDALKRHPARLPPPWYNFLLPDRFYLAWIDCPHATVTFPFQDGSGTLRDLHLYATMINRDFRYFSYNGTLEFPWLPHLAINNLDLFVTHQATEIYDLVVSGLNQDPAHADIVGHLGMKSDKSMDVQANFSQLPFTPVLPPELRDRLTGRATGKLTYHVNNEGKDLRSSGQISLVGGELKDWRWLTEFSRIQNNPDLRDFKFDEASLRYQIAEKKFQATDVFLRVRDKVTLRGNISYDLPKKVADLDVKLTELPLSAWLPGEFLPGSPMRGHATLVWNGPVNTLVGATGHGEVIFDGSEIVNPLQLQSLLGRWHLQLPDRLVLKDARVQFSCENAVIHADQIVLEIPDLASVRGQATLDSNQHLSSNTEIDFPNLTRWLPETLAKNISGSLKANLQWEASRLHLGQGNGQGEFSVSNGELSNLKFQQDLTRFFNDRSLLVLHPTRATVDWRKEATSFVVENLNLLCPGQLGLRGNVTIEQDHRIHGQIQVGLDSRLLTWLPEAKTTVFSESHDGLHWANVHLTGTTSEVHQDLLSQIEKQLAKHPLSLITVGGKAISWFLGNLFN